MSNNEIEQIASADFPTRWGQFSDLRLSSEASVLMAIASVEEAVALVMGDINLLRPGAHSLAVPDRRRLPLLALRLPPAARTLAFDDRREGAGILIYEQQEGRGIGLMAKLQAYELQDAGLDTVEANERLGFNNDYRDFTLPAEILRALGVSTRAPALEQSLKSRGT